MKSKIIKFVFLVSLFFSVQGFSNPINKIDFIGLNVISSNSLITILPVKIGDNYNQNTSDEIIKALFNTGYFSDISVSNQNNDLTITLSENPYIKYFNVSTGSGSSWSDWLNNEQELLDLATLNEFI
jgi:outer membrane protein insertion porin family